MRHPFAPMRDWFFEEGDAAAAAALRIGFAVTYLYMLWDLYPVMDLLMGHAGYFGTLDPKYVDASGIANLLFRYDSPFALRVWFWSFTAAAVLLALGLHTRVAAAAAFFLLLIFQQRNSFMLFGADGVLFQISLWLLFLKSGRVWSLDRWIALRRGAAARRTIPLWPIKAMQIQIALVYFMTAVGKLGTEPWTNGSAIYYALQSLGNDRFDWILGHKLALTGLTYGTLWIEFSFIFLVFWKPTRWLALLQAAFLHAGIDVLMTIRFFGVVMYLGLLTFVRPEEWLRLQAWAASRLQRSPRSVATGTQGARGAP